MIDGGSDCECMQDAVDQQPMTDMISYFQNSGAAADGLHNRLSGVFWWAWNSNAGRSPAGACLRCSLHREVYCQAPVPGLAEVDMSFCSPCHLCANMC